MIPSSLRLRLVLAATILFLAAIAAAGLALTLAFDRALDQRALDELQDYILTLSAQVDVGAGGALQLGAQPSDPRFRQPYGGLYWQIDPEKGDSLHSRSLWDTVLTMPSAPAPLGTQNVHELQGPGGSRLFAAERTIEIKTSRGPMRLRVVAALDRRELAVVRDAYLAELVPSLALLGLALIAAMTLFIGYAFVPFRRLQAALADVHAGRSQTIRGKHPEEVRPLIDDLNELIARQNQSLEQARTQAGDLAHGLKTPTVVLEALADEVSRRGLADLSAEVSQQVSMIRGTVDRALKRARAGLSAARGYRRIAAAPVAAKIVAALAKTPRGQALTWQSTFAEDSEFPGDETDLYEIIGNLVDNAMKWARTRVVVNIAAEDRHFVLIVEDDGPGMAEGVAETVSRGNRLDEVRSGSGFGLAIVKDLVEAYRGSVAFGRSEIGGLRARIEIPV